MASESLKKYKELLPALLPKGKLWRPNDQPVFKSLLDAFAVELCRVDDKVEDLLFQADPRQATIDEGLIEEYERLLGLPDECTPDDQDLQDRRDQIVQKLTNIGGLSKTFYEFIGDQLGFDISVDNDVNFIVGRSRVGEALTNYFNVPFTVGMTVGEQLLLVGWRYYFSATLPITAANFFEVGSNTVGDPLVEFTSEIMECTLVKLKPAHSAIFFKFV